MAADCNTAAVFHLMRAVEWGLRALCVDLGFRKLKRRNSKTGEVRYTPIAYEDWDNILGQLQKKVETRLAATTRGPRKQLYQEFYYPAIQDIKAMKDAWRNHVMHARREYTARDADAILDRVGRLMQLLATRIGEV